MDKKIQKIYLKRFFSIGSVCFLNSLLPILCWQFIGLVFNDNTLINNFNITYSFQFVFTLFLSLFVSGNIIYDEKVAHNTRDYTFSGFIIGNIISIAMCIFLTFNLNIYLDYLNLDVKYTYFVLYSLWQLTLNFMLMGIMELCYFEDNDRLAFIYTLIFDISYMAIFVICIKILKFSYKNAVILSVIILFIFLLYLCFKHMHKFSFKLNVFKGFKYVTIAVFDDLMMFITYFFGMHSVFIYSSSFVFASSVAALCTDASWDMIVSSICTVTKIELLKTEQNQKNVLNNLCISSSKFIYLIILVVYVLGAILFLYYKPDLLIFIVLLLYETLDMFLYKNLYVIKTYLNMEHSSIYLVINLIINKVFRLALSLLIVSPYALWIGQVASGVYSYISYNLLYSYYTKKGEKR